MSKFYDEIAKKADLTSQSEQNTLTENNREYNVDMTSDEIVTLYEERRQKNSSAHMEVLFPNEDLSGLRTLLKTENEREKQLQILLLRTLFSLSTRHQAFFGQEILGA